MKVAQSLKKLWVFFQNNTKCVESDYAGRNTVLYSRPLDVGYCARAIGIFEAQTWHFRERNGHLLLSITSRQNRNMECRRSSRCTLPVSRIPTNSTVCQHFPLTNTVWRSSALTHLPRKCTKKCFRELDQATVFCKERLKLGSCRIHRSYEPKQQDKEKKEHFKLLEIFKTTCVE